VTNRLALFAHWSVRQKLNSVSLVQSSYVTPYASLGSRILWAQPDSDNADMQTQTAVSGGRRLEAKHCGLAARSHCMAVSARRVLAVIIWLWLAVRCVALLCRAVQSSHPALETVVLRTSSCAACTIVHAWRCLPVTSLLTDIRHTSSRYVCQQSTLR